MKNKQELLEQQKKLQEELDRLKELIEETDNIKRWRANIGEDYYFLEDNGSVSFTIENKDLIDICRYEIDNYFKTEEEALERRKLIKIKTKLKDLALRLNAGEEIDLKNHNQKKYYFRMDAWDDLKQNYNCEVQYIGAIYCLDKSFLETAKKEIGEESLIELIKSGV